MCLDSARVWLSCQAINIWILVFAGLFQVFANPVKNIIQKHPGCKKVAANNLKKTGMKKLKLKWVAKAGVMLVQVKINFIIIIQAAKN